MTDPNTYLAGRLAVVTGGAQGIGRALVEALADCGMTVAVIDRQERPDNLPAALYHRGDIADPATLEEFARRVAALGPVHLLVNNAAPHFEGIDTCTWEAFLDAQRVGVVAPYYLTRLLRPHLAEGSSIVNISSTRQERSEPQSESYAAAKGGIGALTHALAVSLGPKTRVNAISPGWIDTRGDDHSDADRRQHPAGRVGTPADIVALVIYLSTPDASFITGQNITVDGGMSRLMTYHGDHGWCYEG